MEIRAAHLTKLLLSIAGALLTERTETVRHRSDLAGYFLLSFSNLHSPLEWVGPN